MKHNLSMILVLCSLAGYAFGQGDEFPTEDAFLTENLQALVDNDGVYYADGPIYVDLVLSNCGPEDRMPDYYPVLPERPNRSPYGSGLYISLEDGTGKVYKFGKGSKPFPPPMGRVPERLLKSGESWRWTVDIRVELKAIGWLEEKSPVGKQFVSRKDLPSGEFELVVQLAGGEESSPVKIRLVRGEEGMATAQLTEALRKKIGAQNTEGLADFLYLSSLPNPILKPEVLEGMELNEQVLPTFRRTVRALATVGKARKGEADNTTLSKLPSETDWGIWADDIAVARYVHAVKTDKEKAKQVRKETETKFPEARWLLDEIDNNPDYCWLYPVF